MKLPLYLVLLATVSSGFHFGCDGSNNPLTGGTCPAFTPCGGNITGTWHLKSLCNASSPGDAATSSSGCTSILPSVELGAGYNATYTFASDGTFQVSASGTMTETAHYPLACYPSDASASTVCSGIGTDEKRSWQGAADAGQIVSSPTSVSCNTQGSDTCTCRFDLTIFPLTESGTYSVSGSRLTITEAHSPGAGGSAPTPADYCVVGNTLTLSDTSASSSTNVIVMTR